MPTDTREGSGQSTLSEELSAAEQGNDRNKVQLIEAVNVRSMSLVILTTVATLYFIDWAQAVLLPLVVAVLISYALDPLVSALENLRVPRALAAALVTVAVIAAIAGASVPLQREAVAMLDKVPLAINQFQYEESRKGPEEQGLMEKAQEAAKKIEESTGDDESAEAARADSTAVRIVEKPFDVQEYLLEGSSAALVMLSQALSTLLLVFFLLTVGSLYKRKVVRISGPSFGRMRKAARIMNEFHQQVRRFLFVMLLGALFVGILTWLAFWLMGVEQAGLWGAVAGVASAIPYLGPFLVLIGTGAAAFIQFGSFDMVFIVGGTSLVITSIQGYLITPFLTSHLSSLNAVVIFVGLIFWGWLWGPIGLIIATPVLMIIKTLCDHVTNLRPVGELLAK